MPRGRSHVRRAALRRGVVIGVFCAGLASGCRSVRVRPMAIVPAHRVADERRKAPTSARVALPDADSAGVVGSPGPLLRRNAEIAAAAIVWLISGGTVAVTLSGTFEENDLFGGTRRSAPDRKDEEPREEEQRPGPRREPLPDWLVPPEPP